MQLKSKIKEVFSDELLKLFASVCDTRRIDSAHKKMKLIQQLLKKYEIPYQPLGGATNRIALMINGYTFKFALDRQGYKDNLMEYALSEELQPYVTKTYETSGYIIVAECIRMMTLEEWHLRAGDIKKVLEMLAQDYLLGDVGYIKKNFTNWGVRDDGSVVILDYAYCHRATENLFTCEVCGSGVLRYDSTYTFLKCSNATVCTAKYEYTERKLIQGDEVDWSMIDEVKEESIIIPKGKKSVEVTDNDGILVDGNIKIINTLDEYYEYLRRNQKMGINFDEEKVLSLTIEQMKTKDPKRKAEIEKELDALVSVEPDDEDIVEKVDMDAINLELFGEEEEQEEGYNNIDYDVCDADYAEDFSSLVKQVSKASHKTNVPIQVPDEEEDVDGVEVQFSEPKLKPHTNVLIEEDETEELEGISVVGGKVQKDEEKKECECHCRKDITIDEAIRFLAAEGYKVEPDTVEEEKEERLLTEAKELLAVKGYLIVHGDDLNNKEVLENARGILETNGYVVQSEDDMEDLNDEEVPTIPWQQVLKDAAKMHPSEFDQLVSEINGQEPTQEIDSEEIEEKEKLSMEHYNPEEKVYREAINPNDEKVEEVTEVEAVEEVGEQSADTDANYKGITLNGEPVGVE